jgi:hypothetical protein
MSAFSLSPIPNLTARPQVFNGDGEIILDKYLTNCAKHQEFQDTCHIEYFHYYDEFTHVAAFRRSAVNGLNY